ncbi:unnamed protein product [Cylicocyclus nassatus]|uniref:Peptidase aspartic putative domain-containing protein n=1 Tax=Cylicocyclus nassatus TaxID=53992 RepID=A0AA36M977_CYLNA|nr:unnamed protein product [Cylicocyclus nassatus]
MDTGSELSFIDSKLVDELQLKVEGNSTLRLKTFGTKLAKEEKHRIVHVDLVDRMGDTHPCKLYDCAILTSKTAEPQLTDEDLSYIKERGLHLSTKTNKDIHPRVLLGCDYLWELMENEKHNLPSGMHLIGTKFGFMLSGKKKKPVTKAASTTLQTSSEDNELDIYDNYWKMESSGIEEYTGTEKEDKQIQEDRILKKFKETIVRKKDGYYVRLPWKEPHEYLPDNRSIALARLKSLLRQYEDRKEFLQEFDNIFKDQLQKGIIEVVEENAGKPRPKGKIIHYLAHQAVVNPEKRTNRKRIDWLTNDDILVARCDGEPLKRVTKRAVLHVNASVFDPLGWLTPLMVRNKHFFQQLWLKPYGWDDLLSEEDQEQWKKLWESIAGFSKQLPRKLGTKQGNYQLIACSDASTYALAAAVYIRQGTEQHLLIAKSKLPSLKMSHTIPKLEINALTIAGRLLLSTFEELKKTINIKTVYLLSDSEIALLAEERKPTEGYRSLTDCATRGLTAEELQHHIWWDGPPTSLTDENAIYEGLERFQLPPDPAEVLQISNASHPLIQVERFSSLRRLKRTVADGESKSNTPSRAQNVKRKSAKRPVNSLIPLELLDSDPGREYLPTHKNPPTPTELPSEPSPETPGRPKRNTSKQYPYSPEEYEINSISTDEKSVTQSNTSIFRMANDPNEFIDNFMNTFNERSSMSEESEL